MKVELATGTQGEFRCFYCCHKYQKIFTIEKKDGEAKLICFPLSKTLRLHVLRSMAVCTNKARLKFG